MDSRLIPMIFGWAAVSFLLGATAAEYQVQPMASGKTPGAVISFIEAFPVPQITVRGAAVSPLAVWDEVKLEWIPASQVPADQPVAAVKISAGQAFAPEEVQIRLRDGALLNGAMAETGGVTLTPGVEDIASGAASNPDTVWYPNGIDGKWLAVGNPNLLNRRDKVTVRFDLTPWVFPGKVERALLRYRQTPFGYRPEAIKVEHFTTERWVLSGKDLISTQAEELFRYVSDPDGAGVTLIEVDVTDAVNADLRRGFGYTTFRVASESADRLANPHNAATGVTIDTNTSQLILYP